MMFPSSFGDQAVDLETDATHDSNTDQLSNYNFGAFQKKENFSFNNMDGEVPFMNKSIGNVGLGHSESDINNTHLTIRSLVSTREAGIIIGKGGKNVSELREISKAKAGISKVFPGVYERVLSISGTLEQVALAFEFMAESLTGSHNIDYLEHINDEENRHDKSSDPVVVRILVCHSLMGSVIGKQGLKIKAIQDMSNTKLIATKEMLPGSTERVIEIHGDAHGIKIAISEVGKSLIEDADRGIGAILYNPSSRTPSISYDSTHLSNYPVSATAHQNGSLPFPAYSTTFPPGFSRQRSHTISASTVNRTNDFINPSFSIQGSSGFGFNDASGFPDATTQPNNKLEEECNKAEMRIRSYSLSHSHVFDYVPGPGIQTQELIIPGDMVGCIIGKAGTRITEIRKLSKSRIAIAKSTDGEEGADRLFTITGTPENNERALILLYGQLEAEKNRRIANAKLAHSLELMYEKVEPVTLDDPKEPANNDDQMDLEVVPEAEKQESAA
ncbi:RNA-binding protein rnc1 [Smittium mucronatum]|uniref:RNA-binding protein rnc1 n=1 Tax=Smittium mucronatum TaxID=133383 RepID=A0A1R0GR82_9FUNG|nr:RNA-binding protein rnc1 [Smittium mucronatum]